MKKFRRIIAALLLLSVGFGLGLAADPNNEAEAAAVVSGFGSGNAATEAEVTPERVKRRLADLNQLAMYSGTYTIEKSTDITGFLFETIRLPGTTKRVSFLCEGVVTVGYQVSEIEPIVDNTNREISIELPTGEILDYYVIWSSLECPEKTGLLSPMAFAEYQGLMMEAEGDLLAQAEAECIYERAEVTVQTIIRNHLACFAGYQVKFS